MDTSHLGEDILTDDRLVWRHGDAAISFHDTADHVELALDDIRLNAAHIFQYSLHARQRCIAATLAETVDSDVNTRSTATDSGQRVGHSHVVVVMGMEVKALVGVHVHHLRDEVLALCRREDAQSIGQQEALDVGVFHCLHHLVDIFW